MITYLYFFGEIFIPGLSQKSVLDKMNMFISKYEAKYLEEVLGYEFAKNFKAGIAADPAATKWKNLRDGAEYTDSCGNLQKWQGFTNTDKISPIANYIYYWYYRNNASVTTQKGEKEDNDSSATNVPGTIKMYRAWNEMVDMNCSLYDYLLNAKEGDALIYSEFSLDKVKRILEKISLF